MKRIKPNPGFLDLLGAATNVAVGTNAVLNVKEQLKRQAEDARRVIFDPVDETDAPDTAANPFLDTLGGLNLAADLYSKVDDEWDEAERAAQRKRGRKMKRGRRNPITEQINIPSHLSASLGDEHINDILNSENPIETVQIFWNQAVAEDDYWGAQHYSELYAAILAASTEYRDFLINTYGTENPAFTVSVEAPAVRESVDVKALTMGGAMRKGKRQLRAAAKRQPKWAVERNPYKQGKDLTYIGVDDWLIFAKDAEGNLYTKSVEGHPLWYDLALRQGVDVTDTLALGDMGTRPGEIENLFVPELFRSGEWNQMFFERDETGTPAAELEKLFKQRNPLKRGKRHAGRNISELVAAGFPHNQAVAIGLKAAGVSRNPEWVLQQIVAAENKEDAENTLATFRLQEGFLGGRILEPVNQQGKDYWRVQMFWEDAPNVTSEELQAAGLLRVIHPATFSGGAAMLQNPTRRKRTRYALLINPDEQNPKGSHKVVTREDLIKAYAAMQGAYNDAAEAQAAYKAGRAGKSKLSRALSHSRRAEKRYRDILPQSRPRQRRNLILSLACSTGRITLTTAR
jgi:hypothetical protein